MATEDLIQLQSLSHGIKPDLYAEGWHQCYYSVTAGNSRDEEYYFPCSNDKECCGRECCTPAPGGFPLWLLILLVVLGFLILLVVVLCIVYCCWKYCCKRKKAPTPPPKKPVVYQKVAATTPPPPKVEMYKRTPLITGGTLRRIPSDNLIEIKTAGGTSTNTVTTPLSFNSLTGYSYGYGPPTATRPKNFYTTTTTSTTLGGASPRQRARRVQAFRNHQLQHSTATDSSPGDEHIGPRISDPSLTDRDTIDPLYHASGTGNVAVHRPGLTTGSGSERYSLTMTTPTSNTASEREPPFMPSPMEETFVSAPRPIHIQHHDETEFTQEKRPLLSHVETPREQTARVDYLRPFIPDPMEEITLPPPVRAEIVYHHSSEISKARFPERTVILPPESKRAQVIYHIPGEDEVAAY